MILIYLKIEGNVKEVQILKKLNSHLYLDLHKLIFIVSRGFVLLLSLRSFLCCGEPHGFGFVQYLDPADAEDAKYHMDGQILFGRELTVVFAVENRKKPAEMRARDRSRGRVSERRRSISHSPRYGRSYPRSPGYYSPSPRCRHYSRSISPHLDTGSTERGLIQGLHMAQGTEKGLTPGLLMTQEAEAEAQ
ncbi:SC35-like splicing factor 33 [Actinidia rufa]|uniref:SC35-like splicing factor 33 n=1 Tax=Actinidia rufa TaxID=165716 RepID=A0A7J0F4G7_9ERIC|nr:SC35-like splicing factor 33 [Actinidia rufa]